MSNAEQYFLGDRADIAALVPLDSGRILDVGCGFGGLGRTLRQRGRCEVYGIEVNPAAAAHLTGVYREFWIGDVERVTLPVGDDFFDCLVFADVLEHLADPWGALRRYAKLVRRGGHIVASVPNVRNLALLYNLALRGRWSYRDSGILDRGHLRFFTRIEIMELFAQAGLEAQIVGANRDRYRGLRRLLTALPLALVPELGVCQFLVRATKP